MPHACKGTDVCRPCVTICLLLNHERIFTKYGLSFVALEVYFWTMNVFSRNMAWVLWPWGFTFEPWTYFHEIWLEFCGLGGLLLNHERIFTKYGLSFVTLEVYFWTMNVFSRNMACVLWPWRLTSEPWTYFHEIWKILALTRLELRSFGRPARKQ
jgi:hypothetical protein